MLKSHLLYNIFQVEYKGEHRFVWLALIVECTMWTSSRWPGGSTLNYVFTHRVVSQLCTLEVARLEACKTRKHGPDASFFDVLTPSQKLRIIDYTKDPSTTSTHAWHTHVHQYKHTQVHSKCLCRWLHQLCSLCNVNGNGIWCMRC